jgi:predicted DNA-binding transcriptional regulator YafY
VREWSVAPLGLVLKSGTWYVVVQGRGRSGQDRLMTFRVAGVRAFKSLNENFKRPKDFDLASHWGESLSRFEDSLRPHRAELLLLEEGCKRLTEAGAFAAAAVRAAAAADAQGWRHVSLPYESPDQAARLLLSLGATFRIVGPPELMDSVTNLAEAVLAMQRNNKNRAPANRPRANVEAQPDAALKRRTTRLSRAPRPRGVGITTRRKGDAQ